MNWYIYLATALIITTALMIYVKFLHRRESKATKWLYETSTLFVFAALIINAIAIIYRWDNLTDAELLAIITTISMMITILFIQQSLNESKKTNDHLIAQNLFNYYQERVAEFKEEGNTKLILYKEDADYKNILNLSNHYQYDNIGIDIPFLLKKIVKEKDRYTSLYPLEADNTIPSNYLDEYLLLEDAIQPCRFGLHNVLSYMTSIADFFEEVSSSNLDILERQIIYNRLAKSIHSYMFFCRNMREHIYDRLNFDGIFDLQEFVILPKDGEIQDGDFHNTKFYIKYIHSFINDSFQKPFDRISSIYAIRY
jgi:hypothetical protein